MENSDGGQCDTELNDCCKRAVEQYRQKVIARNDAIEAKKSHIFVWVMAAFLPLALYFGPNGVWGPTHYFFSVMAALCWWIILSDIRKWIKKSRENQGSRG
jgi:hypothetical protein